MDDPVENVIVLYKSSYEFCPTFGEEKIIEKKFIIPHLSSGIFHFLVHKQKSETNGEHLIVTVNLKNDNRDYRVDIRVECKIRWMRKETTTGMVTNLYPISKSIAISSNTSSSNKCYVEFQVGSVNERLLLDEWKIFLNNGSNVTFIASDGHVKVPKLLLQIRSPVFKAMFSHDMTENETLTINLEDFDTMIIKTFCDFLSTDQVKPNTETALKLYLLADKYDVRILKQMMRNYIFTNLKDFDPNEIFLCFQQTNEQLIKKLLIEKHEIEVKSNSCIFD